MSMIELKLQSLGYEMKEAIRPIASYIPAKMVNNLVFTSGQIPLIDGKLAYQGHVGSDVSQEEAYDAAKICAFNALKAIRAIIGDLDRIESIVKVVGYVSCNSSFSNAPQVVNGASDFLVELFGKEIGSHARSAIGVVSLPMNAPCEIELIVSLFEAQK